VTRDGSAEKYTVFNNKKSKKKDKKKDKKRKRENGGGSRDPRREAARGHRGESKKERLKNKEENYRESRDRSKRSSRDKERKKRRSNEGTDKTKRKDKKRRKEKKRGRSPSDGSRKDTADSDRRASVDTFECLNIIDDRLLEDVDPRKLSFLKHQAEKKTMQQTKKRRHFNPESGAFSDRHHGLSFINPTSESPTAWAIKHLIPNPTMTGVDIQQLERRIKRDKHQKNVKRRSVPHADSDSKRNSALSDPRSHASYPGEEDPGYKCQCVIM